MIRITNTTVKRHKKILKEAKGMRGARRRCFSSAKQAVHHKMSAKSISEKLLRRDMRKRWIERIAAFTRTYGVKYSAYINKFGQGRSRKCICEEIELNPNLIVRQLEKIKILK